jgi:hypothetical protein
MPQGYGLRTDPVARSSPHGRPLAAKTGPGMFVSGNCLTASALPGPEVEGLIVPPHLPQFLNWGDPNPGEPTPQGVGQFYLLAGGSKLTARSHIGPTKVIELPAKPRS